MLKARTNSRTNLKASSSRGSHRDEDSAASGRVSRQNWIDIAVSNLAKDSVAALRVDELAEQLGVTKGSFYWHFENREALLQAVLLWWRDLMTNQMPELLAKLPNDPRQRIEKIIRIGLSSGPSVPGGPFELSLRDWARRDAKVRKIVNEVDEARVHLLVDLYGQLGLSATQARDYAHAHMAFVIGDRMTSVDDDPQELRRRRRIAVYLLIPEMNPT